MVLDFFFPPPNHHFGGGNWRQYLNVNLYKCSCALCWNIYFPLGTDMFVCMSQYIIIMQAKLITTLCRVAGTNNFSPRHDLKKNSPSCFTAGIKELYKKHPGLSLQKLQFFLEKSISLPFILKLDKNILLVLIKCSAYNKHRHCTHRSQS